MLAQPPLLMAQQLLPADAHKIRVNFFNTMYNYIKLQKYSLEYPISTMYDCWSKVAALSSTCLDFEDECKLKAFADSLPEDSSTPPTVTPCVDQGTITITPTISTCTYALGLTNPQTFTDPGNLFESKAKTTLTQDSIYHYTAIDVVKLSDCQPTIERVGIIAGCDSGGCTDNLKFSAGTSFSLALARTPAYADVAVKQIRLYNYGPNHALPTTPLDLNISPAGVAAWNACSGCVPVVGTDLYFGSPNFPTAFRQHLKNVARTLFGQDATELEVTPQGDSYGVTFKTKHQPSGVWVGPMITDFRMQWENQLTGATTWRTYTPFVTIQNTASIPYFYAPITLWNLPCNSNWDSIVQGPAIFQLSDTSRFYRVDLASQFSIAHYLTIDPPEAETCNFTTLVASYPSSLNVVSTQWRDSLNNILASNTDSYLVTTPGTYSFYLTTANGCVLSQSYNYAP
jgi:hypothetical protein